MESLKKFNIKMKSVIAKLEKKQKLSPMDKILIDQLMNKRLSQDEKDYLVRAYTRAWNSIS